MQMLSGSSGSSDAGEVGGSMAGAGWRPFRREGLWRRIGAFAVVVPAAEASVALPPGPSSIGYTCASVVVLVLTACAVVFVPWDRLPNSATTIVPVAYIASVLLLVLAAGGANSGIGVVVLIPLVWTALHQRRWQCLVVVAAVVVVQVTISFNPVELSGAVIARRATFWAVLGIVVSFGIQDLRDRLHRTVSEREALLDEQAEYLRQMEAINRASEQLTRGLGPSEVIAVSVRLLAELATPLGEGTRRAQYLCLRDGLAHFTSGFDESGAEIRTAFPVAEHPRLHEAFITGEPFHGPVELDTLGPTVREMITAIGATHGMFIPLRVDGATDGVIVVSMRRADVTPGLFEECQAAGHLGALALGNAYAHEQMLAMATTDELTGLANRRSFEQLMAQVPGRGAYAILVFDVDGLKAVNDSEGHLAGDELIVSMARAATVVLRRGDVLARTGGDEFALLCLEADAAAGEQVAQRLLDAFAAPPSRGRPGRASIGVAVGSGGVDSREVYAAADAAMYRAKVAGGDRYALASPGTAGPCLQPVFGTGSAQ
jgi:diguanylate cyclase (GGDEF)-like protein